MRGKSHRYLGQYLVAHYMHDIPNAYQKAFLIGCVEPDRNPMTYLKGSIRFQWLRGHNFRNAERYIRRVSHRLAEKQRLSAVDYYTLGKLIHYTADAFTLAHNTFFPSHLAYHRRYEIQLQEYFLQYISENPEMNVTSAKDIMSAILSYHLEYSRQTPHIHTDAAYILRVCCCVLSSLLANHASMELTYAPNFDHLS